MVRRPAKVDELESHNGAETIPDEIVSLPTDQASLIVVTILDQNVQALFNSQGSIKDDQAKAEGQDIVACADLEEVADRMLDERERSCQLVSYQC